MCFGVLFVLFWAKMICKQQCVLPHDEYKFLLGPGPARSAGPGRDGQVLPGGWAGGRAGQPSTAQHSQAKGEFCGICLGIPFQLNLENMHNLYFLDFRIMVF